MWRVHLSRTANYYLLSGRKGEMVSTRCEREERLFWRAVINWSFFIIRGEIDHCANMRQLDAQTDQGPTGETQAPAAAE